MAEERSFKYYSGSQDHGIFAIRGDLDGEEEHDFQDGLQYIGLVIDDEEFLLPIGSIKEIVMLNQLTYVPQSPKFIEGVVNLRGAILPAINLRRMMGLATIEPAPAARIIVARHGNDQLGLIVDAITYVVTIHQSDRTSPTISSHGPRSEIVTDLAKRGDKVSAILDIEKIVSRLLSAGRLVPRSRDTLSES